MTDLDSLVYRDALVRKRVTPLLDAHRRAGMNLIVQDDDGRIVRIAPDGTETDVTAELDRRVFEATGGKPSPAP